MIHNIEIRHARRQTGGNWVGHGSYFVSYLGEPMGEMRIPTCEGARWLLANGHATEGDTIVMCREGRPALSGNIGVLSKLTVIENETTSPTWVKHQPMSDGRLLSLRSRTDGKVAAPAMMAA